MRRFLPALALGLIACLSGNARSLSAPAELNDSTGNPIQEMPECIYVVGSLTDWLAPDSANVEFYQRYRMEKADSANVYTGVFELPEGETLFRFYSRLDGWDNGGSIGSGEVYGNLGVGLKDGYYFGSVVPGTGNWYLLNPGGLVRMEVDLDNFTLYMSGPSSVAIPYGQFVFPVGSFSEWREPSWENMEYYCEFIAMSGDNAPSGVYRGAIPRGDRSKNLMVRFYDGFFGWDSGSIGIQENDEPKRCDFAGGSFVSGFVRGKGTWELVGCDADSVYYDLDMVKNRVVFSVGRIFEDVPVAATGEIDMGAGIDAVDAAVVTEVSDGSGELSVNFSGAVDATYDAANNAVDCPAGTAVTVETDTENSIEEVTVTFVEGYGYSGSTDVRLNSAPDAAAKAAAAGVRSRAAGGIEVGGNTAVWKASDTRAWSVTFVEPAGTVKIKSVAVKYQITVAEIEAVTATPASAPVEYYNLQGVRIAEPARGSIVLRRTGSVVEKIMVR